MAYNHRKAEIEWLNWKEKEEKQMRELGVDEDTIQCLHTYDWQQFNKERQFLQRWKDEICSNDSVRENQKQDISSVEKLIDEIENEQLLTVLCTTDKLTLEMLVLRLRGYSSKEIAEGMRMTVNAVDLRLYKLRKKIKKFL
ncbi:sigma-70 family RNA polymerase sigma factor [Subdoligranulum sp. AM16-9]|uniref:sigma-70 family RNA polymerase sigma factor n=1 Tax=Ruthenibacterium lactatiformans TaxID=1550024 RepID=UPI000E3F85B5|nr:sigma-70 family RNA polymerase sigma factor [Ruthenibacterium lactatiformans]RGC96733.1 sigma-70 family RNA polymerase sigma factor [Subdoligranulum sp. AM16-9]